MTETDLPIRTSLCPICAAPDAFVDTLRDGDEYYVECVNCGVYRASRRAFRLFQYLRDKADGESLRRLDYLAGQLKLLPHGAATHLEYDTWDLAKQRPLRPFGTARAI